MNEARLFRLRLSEWAPSSGLETRVSFNKKGDLLVEHTMPSEYAKKILLERPALVGVLKKNGVHSYRYFLESEDAPGFEKELVAKIKKARMFSVVKNVDELMDSITRDLFPLVFRNRVA